MLPYFYVYIFTMLSLFFYDVKQLKKIRWIFLLIAIFSLSSLYYLRDFSIGLDTYTYVEIASNISKLNSLSELIDYSSSYSIEIGFVLFVYFLSYVGFNISSVFFISAFLIYYNLGYVLSKIKINAILYFAGFFSYCSVFLWSFNILRQMIAISFVVLAVNFLLRKSTGKFILFTLIASIFHYSALLCILFYFIYKKIDTVFTYRWLLTLLIFFVSGFFLALISSYYPRYASYSTDGDAKSIGFTLFFIYLIIYLFLGFFEKKIKTNNIEYKFYLSVFSIYIGLQTSFIINGISSFGTTRILIYFLWPLVVLIGYFFNNIEDKILRYFLNCIFFATLSLYFIYSLRVSGYDYVPFRFLLGS